MSLPTKAKRQGLLQDSTAGLSRRGILQAGSTALTVAALAPLMSACGFKPMYGGRAGSAVVAALAEVEVARINDRTGQLLRNALERRMERAGGGGTAKKRYLLTCGVAESKQELGLSKDSFASRADLTLTVDFTLSYQGKSLLTGSTQGIVAYNILDQQYATVISEQDSRQRAVEQVSEDITRRLSSYFSRHPNSPQAPAAQ
jgi:LPS-assembly lipoprotein